MQSPVPEKNKEQPVKAVDQQRPDSVLPSPILILLSISLAIFAVEALVMGLLDLLPKQSNFIEAAIDSSLLIVLLSPILYFLLFRPVTKHLQMREQAEAALKKSQETQLRDMLATSLDGYWLVDAHGNFLDVNDAYCRMSGYTREELLAMSISDLDAIENPEDTAARIEGLMKTGSINFETQHRRKDGVVLEIEVSANFVTYEGGQIYGFLRDITARKKAETALHQSEERLHIALEGSGDALWELDFQTGKVNLSSTYREMLGYTESDIGDSLEEWRLLVHPDDLPAAIAEMDKVRAGLTDIFSHERRMRCKDGSWKWILKRGVVTGRDDNGLPLSMIGTNSDITERKQAEDALRLLSEITANAAEGIVLIKASDSTIEYTNRRFELLFGYAPGELIGKHISILNAPTNKTPQETAAEINQQIEKNGVYSGEVLNLKKDGTKIWTFINVSTFNHPRLGALWVTYQSDISERKESEEALRLASMVYQNSSEAIAVTNSNNQILAVNPAFEKMTGYTAEEILGKNPNIMSSGRHDKEFYQQMWKSIIEDGYWQGEMWDKRKNGEIYAKALSINSIKSEDGSVYRYVALFTDVTERKQSEELIWKQANFDTLTGLPNRRMFMDRLQLEITKSERSRLPLALMLIDLDQFKEVNDTLGHAVGDTLLKEAAYRIRSCVRTSDTVARLGGDEFTVILSEIPDSANIEDIGQKIIDKLSEYFMLGNEAAYISASIGITVYPNDASNTDDLMRNADQAMYVAKRNGRNRFCYYTQSLQEAAQKRLRMTNDLRNALGDKQLRVYFQPIINLATGRVYKAEALLRWQHPERGMVSPMDFIPLAEESGLIHEIGDWVFRESVRWAKHWSQKFSNDFQISVNKSPLQFREDSSYSGAWLSHLHELGLSGKHIVVEITEGLLLNAETGVTDKLLSFRDAGIQVAIDDFGTGYSSLSYLKKFDIDYLKIDQSFVRNLTTDKDDMALCEAIIVMAHKLDLKVIAEGVETEEQKVLLTRAGCDYAQGYLLSKPVPPDELEIYLKNL